MARSDKPRYVRQPGDWFPPAPTPADLSGTATQDDIDDLQLQIDAGLLNPADKAKLDGIATGATANSSDATLLARGNHTGTQSIATILAAATARFFGRITASGGAGEELTGTQATSLLDVATTLLKGLMSSTDKSKLDGIASNATANSSDATLLSRANHTGTQSLDTTTDSASRLAMTAAERVKVAASSSAVEYTTAGSAKGAAIADYFPSTLSLEANSTYEIECHAYFLKTTAGTVIWTWAFSSAPIMATSRCQHTPVTGFTTSVITGAETFIEATQEAPTAMAHAATASLTTAVRHSHIFMLRIRTNAATTLQLRCTESAGTVTPQAGSYMRARKIV